MRTTQMISLCEHEYDGKKLVKDDLFQAENDHVNLLQLLNRARATEGKWKVEKVSDSTITLEDCKEKFDRTDDFSGSPVTRHEYAGNGNLGAACSECGRPPSDDVHVWKNQNRGSRRRA